MPEFKNRKPYPNPYQRDLPPLPPVTPSGVRKKKPWFSRLKWGRLLVVMVVGLILASSFFGFLTSFIMGRFSILELFLTLTPGGGLTEETNILVLGIDATPGAKRSDTIMVAHVDPRRRAAGLLSVQRDTLGVIPGRGYDKLNHAFAFGGVDLSRQSISGFLGIDIPYYVKVDVPGLIKLVDRLGGVTIAVEKRMYYVDYAGGLFVNLYPGVQRLSGKQAIGYVRFRHDAQSDFGRVERQQKFIRAIGQELSVPANLLKIPNLLADFTEAVETNMSTRQILGLASILKEANELNQIEMGAVPGAGEMINGVYYLRTDPAAVRSSVDRYLRSRGLGEKVKAPESNYGVGLGAAGRG